MQANQACYKNEQYFLINRFFLLKRGSFFLAEQSFSKESASIIVSVPKL